MALASFSITMEPIHKNMRDVCKSIRGKTGEYDNVLLEYQFKCVYNIISYVM